LSTVSRFLPFLFALAPHFPVAAAELEGVRLEDQIRVDGQELQLNGFALRTRFIFKVYVAGLYLPAKTTTAHAAIESRSAKRILLVMMRDATADQFVESTDTAMRANNSAAQIAAVQAQVDELFALIRAAGEAKKGMRIVLDYAPSDGGTTLFIEGVAQGKPMLGEEFYKVLLRIWLGEDPVQQDLKEALLGGVQ
jgi:hypothetical protein